MGPKAVEKLPARTAARQQSIWQGVSEQTFYRNVQILSEKNPNPPCPDDVFRMAEIWHPVKKSSTSRPIRESDAERLLSIEDEGQLANDIAFIAASEEGVAAVSAACVEEKTQTGELIVHLAANEGVSATVQNAVAGIARALQQASSDRAGSMFRSSSCLVFLSN